jgi:hypothetical protein
MLSIGVSIRCLDGRHRDVDCCATGTAAPGVSGFGNPLNFGGQEARLTGRTNDRRGNYGVIGDIVSKRTVCRIKSLFGEKEK